MFASEGVNVWKQLLSLFAFGGGLEKVENASQGLILFQAHIVNPNRERGFVRRTDLQGQRPKIGNYSLDIYTMSLCRRVYTILVSIAKTAFVYVSPSKVG